MTIFIGPTLVVEAMSPIPDNRPIPDERFKRVNTGPCYFARAKNKQTAFLNASCNYFRKKKQMPPSVGLLVEPVWSFIDVYVDGQRLQQLLVLSQGRDATCLHMANYFESMGK